MELMDSTLDAALEWTGAAALATSDKLQLLLDVARGLTYLHTHGIMHRDLTAVNVLLRRRPAVPATAATVCAWMAAVSDFGAAREVLAAGGGTAIAAADRKELTLAPGSPCYAAPETLLGGEEQGPEQDVYSFGVLLYRVLFAKAGAALPSSHYRRQEAFAAALLPTADPLRLAVMAAISERPRDRPTVADLCSRLEAAAAAAAAPVALAAPAAPAAATSVPVAPALAARA
jgi:serine/threonine protein kinase